MKRAQWRNHVGLPILLMTAILSTAVTPAAMSAGLRPVGPAEMDCQTVTPATAATSALAQSDARRAAARVQPQVAAHGEITGRTVTGRTVAGREISIVLPVESFVAPAAGDLVLYTRHSVAIGSEVRALNLASGCDILLAAPAQTVRSAILDQSATHVYVHSVTRGARADAGVTRYELASGKSSRALAPVRPPAGFGPIFGTDLRWSVAGDRLAVQSCGFSRCLTRVLKTATGKVTTYAELVQGAFIGVTDAHLITFGQCPGLPCAVLSTDLATGSVSVLAPEGFSAQLKASGKGTAIVSIETSAGAVEVVQ